MVALGVLAAVAIYTGSWWLVVLVPALTLPLRLWLSNQAREARSFERHPWAVAIARAVPLGTAMGCMFGAMIHSATRGAGFGLAIGAWWFLSHRFWEGPRAGRRADAAAGRIRELKAWLTAHGGPGCG